jgi:vitamin B12 transporter
MGMFCFFSLSFSQSSKDLKEVIILQKKDTLSLNSLDQKLSKKEISAIPAEDVGVITQKIAGISLKSYGGLGGLKTISYRGISGNHSVVLLNEFALNNQQVGQVDLGSIQTENVESIRFSTIVNPTFLFPVSSLVAANTLSIQTFENAFTGNSNQFRFSSKIGSFNQVDNYLSYKRVGDNRMISVYGKNRRFSGNYPFYYQNGNHLLKENRSNNDLIEWNTGIHFSRIYNNNRLNLAYHFYQSDKGLPGAVIFYNNLTSQRLVSQNQILQVENILCRDRFSNKMYISFQSSNMIYTDPNYLNSEGKLVQNFLNNSFLVGNTFNKIGKDSLVSIYGGVEYQFHSLSTNNTTLIYNPKRNVAMIVLGLKLKRERLNYQLQANNHQVISFSNQVMNYNTYLTGSLFVENNKPLKFIGLPRFLLSRTLRLPTFGEMYINTVINKEIKPEIANQANLGSSIYILKCKVGADVYFNVIENKIVAIPSKNLFLWSVQNIGKVMSKGIDFSFEKTLIESPKQNLVLKGVYSFQSVQDYSSPISITYKQQVVYIPKNTVNLDVNYEVDKKFSFNWNTYFVGNRYALNENIPSNIVNAFSTSDFSVNYFFKFKNESSIKCNFSIKNIFNASYHYIRYYVMPGRNYLVSISYVL